jgi:hypothetical protein
MDWALQGGYAVSGTDTGHSGGSLEAGWALGHPEKIVDFGWRGVHETAVASKAIIEAYYAKAPTHAYFAGCSDGGREALMEAQRFPKDYDGIVAGAPANAWTKLLANAIWNDQALAASKEGWISPEKLAIVSDAALKACHGEDGYLDDRSQCRFDPSMLVCKSGQTDQCLSEPDVAALKKLYSGLHDAAGKAIYPGYPPGGETGPVAWRVWISGQEPNRMAGTLLYYFGTGYFGEMVFDKPDWDFKGQNVIDGLAKAQEKTAAALDSADPISAALRPRAGNCCNIMVGATQRSPRRLRSTIMSRSPPRWADWRASGPSIGCSWPPACSTAVWASRPTRSAASSACRRQGGTRRMTSSPRSRTGSKTARRRRK